MGDKSAIAGLAAAQHGVVTTAQLVAAGFSRQAISKLVAAGWLHPHYRGVDAVGHPGLSAKGRRMAAVLACGPSALLSHSDAAALWGMLKPRTGWVHVTVPTAGGRRKRRGIHLHRCPSLPGSATTRKDRIPLTTPTRTLADLKRVVSPGLHRRATRQAEFLGLDLGEIVTDHTRSETERRMLRICSQHRIPPPQVNVPIGPHAVDLIWPDHRLVVEIDSFGTPAAGRGSRTTAQWRCTSPAGGCACGASATPRSGIGLTPLRPASSPRFARPLHKISGCPRRSPNPRTGSCS
jgi:hypothetical protein